MIRNQILYKWKRATKKVALKFRNNLFKFFLVIHLIQHDGCMEIGQTLQI